jgi:hypothetical protein
MPKKPSDLFEQGELRSGEKSFDKSPDTLSADSPVKKETSVESGPESLEGAGEGSKALEKSGEALRAKTKIKTKPKTSMAITDSDLERRKQIDAILSEGLSDVFLSMPPARQEKFKREGEETTKKINELLKKTKVKIGKIVGLIRSWLRIIPNVNRYFLEQEAKIKADKIIKLKK